MSTDGDFNEGEQVPLLPPDTETAVRAAVSGTMPTDSLALYARWWQLETWLRELAYVELRAQFGTAWMEEVREAFPRQLRDAAYTHMTSADTDNPLAYLDYSQMVELMGSHWEQFGYALVERASWDGRQEELKRIRHRIGHLRRPHPDDLGRLEQTLRDLERGTFVALASYNRRQTPDPRHHSDPVTTGWIEGRHPAAQRLIVHAERQYEVTLTVEASRRPWTTWPADLTMAPGVFWHATFILSGHRQVDPTRLWHHTNLETTRPLIVHMLADYPGHVSFTLSGADDADALADAIGELFDAVLMASRRTDLDDTILELRHARARHLDYRLLVDSGWNIVDETTVPITNFNAGGGVPSAPNW